MTPSDFPSSGFVIDHILQKTSDGANSVPQSLPAILADH